MIIKREAVVYQPVSLVFETEVERRDAVASMHNAIYELARQNPALWVTTLATLRKMEALLKEVG